MEGHCGCMQNTLIMGVPLLYQKDSKGIFLSSFFPRLDDMKHSFQSMQIVRKCWRHAGVVVNRYPTVVSTLGLSSTMWT